MAILSTTTVQGSNYCRLQNIHVQDLVFCQTQMSGIVRYKEEFSSRSGRGSVESFWCVQQHTAEIVLKLSWIIFRVRRTLFRM